LYAASDARAQFSPPYFSPREVEAALTTSCDIIYVLQFRVHLLDDFQYFLRQSKGKHGTMSFNIPAVGHEDFRALISIEGVEINGLNAGLSRFVQITDAEAVRRERLSKKTFQRAALW
jgi:hypothetical protein